MNHKSTCIQDPHLDIWRCYAIVQVLLQSEPHKLRHHRVSYSQPLLSFIKFFAPSGPVFRSMLHNLQLKSKLICATKFFCLTRGQTISWTLSACCPRKKKRLSLACIQLYLVGGTTHRYHHYTPSSREGRAKMWEWCSTNTLYASQAVSKHIPDCQHLEWEEAHRQLGIWRWRLIQGVISMP